MDRELGEAEWKHRFEAFALVRLSGLIFIVGGLFVAFRNPLGEEYPLVGGMLALAGFADVLLGPRLLKKYWAEQDR